MALSYEYWAGRIDDIAKGLDQKDKAYLLALKKTYIKASKSIKDEITALYAKYGQNGKIDFKTLASPSDKANMTRLEELQKNLKTEITHMTSQFENTLKKKLVDDYTDGVYTANYLAQTTSGVGVSMAQVSRNAVQEAIRRSLNDKVGNYSDQVWSNRDRLLDTLSQAIMQGVAEGKSANQMASFLNDKMQSNFSNAQRIVRTESSFVRNQATQDTYKEAGAKRYRFVATLDERTCPICGALDGQTFDVADEQPGGNYPPIHPNCRCTTVMESTLTMQDTKRIAKDNKGKYFYVSSDTTYDDWLKMAKGNAPKANYTNNPAKVLETPRASSYKKLKIGSNHTDVNALNVEALRISQKASAELDGVYHDAQSIARGAKDVIVSDRGLALKSADSIKQKALEAMASSAKEDAYLDPKGYADRVNDALHISLDKANGGQWSLKDISGEIARIKDKGYLVTDARKIMDGDRRLAYLLYLKTPKGTNVELAFSSVGYATKGEYQTYAEYINAQLLKQK